MRAKGRSRRFNVIDLAAAMKRREEEQHAAARREEVSFLPFALEEPVSVEAGKVLVVVDRYEGVGLSMEPRVARALARALHRAVRSAK